MRAPKQVRARAKGGGQSVPVTVAASRAQLLIEDLHDFRTASPEEYQGEQVRAKIQVDLARVLEVMRQAEGSQWETTGDQIREALLCWTSAYQELEKRGDPRVTSWIHDARIQAEAAWLDKHQERITTASHRLADHLMHAVARGRFEQAHRALLKHWREIKQIGDDDWRQDYIDSTRSERGVVDIVKMLRRLGYRLPSDMRGALL